LTGLQKKLVTIIIPVFNEEENVIAAHAAVTEVMAPLIGRYDYEIIFTDNHSTDNTFAELRKIAEQDRRVRVLRYSRDFGYYRSLYGGLMNCRGDVAVMLDSDLQDPPSMIPKFLELWESENEVVYGVRAKRKEAFCVTWARKAFYRVLNRLSEHHVPNDAAAFRLVDRRIIEALRGMEDDNPYLPGVVASLGFSQVGVPYARDERRRGRSKFRLWAMVGLAFDGLVGQSVVPLRIAAWFGIITSLLTFLIGIGYVIGRVFLSRDWPPGFATLTLLIMISLSMNALFLGIIGEYIGRIYVQVRKRPRFIIETELGAVADERRLKDEASERKTRVG
jgi:glycosyltransferase involved in cell wall biosynthesis